MSIDNILAYFQLLSGLSSSDNEGYYDIVYNVYLSVSARLKKDASEYTDDEVKELEYACACMAFYDYTVVVLAREARVLTEDGTASLDYEAQTRLKAAALLKDNAENGISSLLSDTDFLFQSV